MLDCSAETRNYRQAVLNTKVNNWRVSRMTREEIDASPYPVGMMGYPGPEGRPAHHKSDFSRRYLTVKEIVHTECSAENRELRENPEAFSHADPIGALGRSGSDGAGGSGLDLFFYTEPRWNDCVILNSFVEPFCGVQWECGITAVF